MKLPFVTVVVLSYNHEKYIAQCLSSIINQTYQNIEVIYIDDGSTDGTFELGCRLLSESSIKHKTLKHKDYWISRNLNIAAKQHASGQYFCMISADDWWDDKNIEKKVIWLEANPDSMMVYSPVKYYYEKDGTTEDMKKKYSSDAIFEDLLKENCIPAHSALFRINAFSKVGYFDEDSKIEDWDLWLRIAKKYKIGFIDEHLCYYRMHDKNYSSNSKAMLENMLYIYKKHQDNRIAQKMYKRIHIYYLGTYAPIPEAVRNLAKNIEPSFVFLKQIVKVALRSLKLR